MAGRKPIERKNYEDAFNKLYEKMRQQRNLESFGNTELLNRMYDRYFKGLLHGQKNRTDWVKSKLPDFPDKIKGNGRGFDDEDIKAIEKATDMRWVDIVEPQAQNRKAKEFKPRGLRYTAYLDDESEYNEWLEASNKGVISSYDEYDKTLLDYIVEFKSEVGLRFLIEHNGLWFDERFGVYSFYHDRKQTDAIWKWLLELDNGELFTRMIDDQKLFFNDYYIEEFGNDDLIEKLIGTTKIFNALCQPRVYNEDNREMKYMPTVLLKILEYALENKEYTVAQMILNAYRKFVDEETERIRKTVDWDSGKTKYVECNSNRYTIVYNGEALMHVWNFEKLQDKYNAFNDDIEYLKPQNILSRLAIKKVKAMRTGDEFNSEGVCYVKIEACEALDALKYLTAEKGCKCLPGYLGEEEGVVKLRAYESSYDTKISLRAEMLGEIHRLSEEKLGAGRTYMYAPKMRIGRIKESGEYVFANWKSCTVGTPMRDILHAFLNFPLLHYSYMNIKYFTEGKERLYEDLCDFLTAYPNKENIKDFGDRLVLELDSIESEILRGGVTDEIERHFAAKSFAHIYRERLNAFILNASADAE